MIFIEKAEGSHNWALLLQNLKNSPSQFMFLESFQLKGKFRECESEDLCSSVDSQTLQDARDGEMREEFPQIFAQVFPYSALNGEIIPWLTRSISTSAEPLSPCHSTSQVNVESNFYRSCANR